MTPARKVCIRCRREGHLSHACKEPNPNHQSESPGLHQQTGASINAENRRKPA